MKSLFASNDKLWFRSNLCKKKKKNVSHCQWNPVLNERTVMKSLSQ